MNHRRIIPPKHANHVLRVRFLVLGTMLRRFCEDDEGEFFFRVPAVLFLLLRPVSNAGSAGVYASHIARKTPHINPKIPTDDWLEEGCFLRGMDKKKQKKW